ncbi:hypothetical protein A2U01_0082584, partial [Trifolium medium]|nr:hypothetical protein [Trifolium medium]
MEYKSRNGKFGNHDVPSSAMLNHGWSFIFF